MKRMIIQLTLLFVLAFGEDGCNGKLSDEQRKRLNEGMKRNAIRKISEAQLTDAAFAFGRAVAERVGKVTHLPDPAIDSVERAYKVRISFLYPNAATLNPIEKQILEAYVDQPATTILSDNVEWIGNDSVLYTKPVLAKMKEAGAEKFLYALGIKTARKQIVLSIKD